MGDRFATDVSDDPRLWPRTGPTARVLEHGGVRRVDRREQMAEVAVISCGKVRFPRQRPGQLGHTGTLSVPARGPRPVGRGVGSDWVDYEVRPPARRRTDNQSNPTRIGMLTYLWFERQSRFRNLWTRNCVTRLLVVGSRSRTSRGKRWNAICSPGPDDLPMRGPAPAGGLTLRSGSRKSSEMRLAGHANR